MDEDGQTVPSLLYLLVTIFLLHNFIVFFFVYYVLKYKSPNKRSTSSPQTAIIVAQFIRERE